MAILIQVRPGTTLVQARNRSSITIQGERLFVGSRIFGSSEFSVVYRGVAWRVAAIDATVLDEHTDFDAAIVNVEE